LIFPFNINVIIVLSTTVSMYWLILIPLRIVHIIIIHIIIILMLILFLKLFHLNSLKCVFHSKALMFMLKWIYYIDRWKSYIMRRWLVLFRNILINIDIVFSVLFFLFIWNSRSMLILLICRKILILGLSNGFILVLVLMVCYILVLMVCYILLFIFVVIIGFFVLI
jgi:hypothetical protein